jgi:hypothetical protein
MGTYQTNDYDRQNPPDNSDNSKEGSEKDRIWNVFKPVIVLDEMSIRKDDGDSKNLNLEDHLSVTYPFIKINDYVFSKNEISYMSIDSRDFLPTISLSVTLSHDLFLSKHFPKDGDIISIMIRNKSDLLNPIRNDYVITGVSQPLKSSTSTETTKMTFFGELFIPGLKSYLGSASFIGTSMHALKSAARLLEIGFNTNEADTDDKQIWYSVEIAIEFIKDTISKAWKDDNSFFDCWIDVYYNLNFINVQKELLADESKIDMAALLNNSDNEFDYGAETEVTHKTAKVFSNFYGLRSSSNYITKWKPDNQSSAITFEYGTTSSVSFYEHQDKLYADPEGQSYWNFEVPPKFDVDKLDTHILLRGRSTYNADINTDQLARANYNYTNLYTRSPWLGIQYTIANPDEDNTLWTGNHHRNYMRAQLHNLVNLVELEKLNIEIKVQGTNTNFIKGEKIPVVIIKTDAAEVRISYPELEQSMEIDFFYSGWYTVKGFKLEWSHQHDDILSNFSQTFVLTRREWPPPEKIKAAAKEDN